PRRSIAHALKCAANRGRRGAHRLRSPVPPWTIRRLGPSPMHSTAIRTPSFDRTNDTWDDGSAVCANGIASAHGAITSDATINVGTRSFMRLHSRGTSEWV